MYGGYEGGGGGPGPYEQQGPPASDSAFYNGYDGGTAQDPYYQNGSYGTQPPTPSTTAYGEIRSVPNGYGQPPYDYEGALS